MLIRRAAYVLLGTVCLFRLATATPQPLDFPGTLRPILYALFTRFVGFYERPQDAFSDWSTMCFVAMLLPVALALAHYASPNLPALLRRVLHSPITFFLSIAVCLFLCRFPTLLERELNPDEGQFLASAHKLFYDPNFFHAVDTGTSGPVNIYPLMLPEIVGVSPDFASSRVMVILIILASAFLLYRAFTLIGSEELARLAILPFTAAFAVFQSTELIHYSSEHVPILLICAALYVTARVLRDPARHTTPLIALGVLVSAAFFAKMQSLPIVAVEAAIALACVYVSGNTRNWWRPALLLFAGGLPLPMINAVLCVVSGVWGDFWMSYIRANSSYADAHTSFVQNLQIFMGYVMEPREILLLLFMCVVLGAAYLLISMRRNGPGQHSLLMQVAVLACVFAAGVFLNPGNRQTIYAFVVVIAIWTLPAYLLLAYLRGRLTAAEPVRWFGLAALLTLSASLFAVYIAHHLFFHYLLFLLPPIAACIAWMLMRMERTHRHVFVALLSTLVIAFQTYLWSFQDDHVFRTVTAIRPPEGDFIRSLTSPKGQIFVWGWTVHPYLLSGRVPATRDTNVSNCFRAYNLVTKPPVFTPTKASLEVSAYYVKRILHDLQANPPELFIDAIGPASWFLDDRKYYGFEQFPGIAEFVRTRYVALPEQYGQRYFLRRDRAPQPTVSSAPHAAATHQP